MGKLNDLYYLMHENLTKLDELLSKQSPHTIIEDFYFMNSVLHILQVSIQALIDMACHLISELKEKPPATYSEAATILKKKDVLSKEEAELMKKMIGFRNIVVHGYITLSLDLVVRILEEKKYKDILKIAKRIMSYARNKNIDC